MIELTIRLVAPPAPANGDREAGGHIEVIIRDTGVGMPPETRARVFEPFFTTKPIGRGTGLGLSIAYGAVKSHGGTIEIASAAGAGTSAIVRLPAEPPANSA
jgi:signal transduction histidine kinase